MPTNDEAVRLTRRELVAFCEEFLEHPYLCYTEHGLHARFAARLYHAIPESERYQAVGAHRMCRVQKEYPTHKHLSKSRRQHWDVSLIAQMETLPTCPCPYDHLPLATVVEFGLNEELGHLKDDIERLAHSGSNVHQGFAAHLFRLSKAQGRLSMRDMSPGSSKLSVATAVLPLLAGSPVEVYLGVFDPTNKNSTGLWRVTATDIVPLVPATRQTAQPVTIPQDLTTNLPAES